MITEGALKTGQGLEAKSMLLILKGACKKRKNYVGSETTPNIN